MLKRSFTDKKFNFSFKSRSDESMVESLGLVLARIAEYTPGGILVFFPSYSYMNFVFNIWWKGDTLDKI